MRVEPAREDGESQQTFLERKFANLPNGEPLATSGLQSYFLWIS